MFRLVFPILHMSLNVKYYNFSLGLRSRVHLRLDLCEGFVLHPQLRLDLVCIDLFIGRLVFVALLPYFAFFSPSVIISPVIMLQFWSFWSLFTGSVAEDFKT